MYIKGPPGLIFCMVWWQTDDKCYLTELNVAGDALVREGGPRHLGLDVPEPRARQEAVRVLGVVDGHEERPRPVQFGQLQVQVGVVRLREGKEGRIDYQGNCLSR